jgi:hypothetical protein
VTPDLASAGSGMLVARLLATTDRRQHRRYMPAPTNHCRVRWQAAAPDIEQVTDGFLEAPLSDPQTTSRVLRKRCARDFAGHGQRRVRPLGGQPRPDAPVRQALLRDGKCEYLTGTCEPGHWAPVRERGLCCSYSSPAKLAQPRHLGESHLSESLSGRPLLSPVLRRV